MTSPAYHPGEKIRVTIQGRITGVPDNVHTDYEVTMADGMCLRLQLAAPDTPLGSPLTVERLEPATGIPKPGEIWADAQGGEWFAVEGSTGANLYNRAGGWKHWWELHRHIALGPIYRVRDAAPPPEADEDEVAF